MIINGFEFEIKYFNKTLKIILPWNLFYFISVQLSFYSWFLYWSNIYKRNTRGLSPPFWLTNWIINIVLEIIRTLRQNLRFLRTSKIFWKSDFRQRIFHVLYKITNRNMYYLMVDYWEKLESQIQASYLQRNQL
jgi:hypothetical protein